MVEQQGSEQVEGLSNGLQRDLHLYSSPQDQQAAGSIQRHSSGPPLQAAPPLEPLVDERNRHAPSLRQPSAQSMSTNSYADSSNSNLLAPPDQLRPTSSIISNGTVASESWTSPEESEGDYVRKTYMHFDKIGVKGDGIVEGKEWTRHRAADGPAPWDAEAEGMGASGSLSRSNSERAGPRLKTPPSRETATSENSQSRTGASRNDNLDPSSAASSPTSPRRSLQRTRRAVSSSSSAAAVKSSPLAAPPTTANDYLQPSSQSLQGRTSCPSSPRSRWRSSRKSEGFAHFPPLGKSPSRSSQDEAYRHLEAPLSTMSAASSSTSLASTSAYGNGTSRSVSGSGLLHPNGAAARPGRIASASSTLSPLASPHGGASGRRMSESEMSEITELDSVDWGLQQEAEQRKRFTLGSRRFGGAGIGDETVDEEDEEEENWKRLDRYGFFSRDWSGQHGRICILPAATFSLVPNPGNTRSQSSKMAAASRAARSVVSATEVSPAQPVQSLRSSNPSRGVTPVASPHLGHTSNSSAGRSAGTGTPASSASAGAGAGDGETVEQHPKADAISAFRAKSQQAQREKEQSRIDKWSQMLVPGEKKGANTAFYTIRDDLKGSSKLERRVFKGIPDRWRSGAWWALVEMGTAQVGEGSTSSKTGTSQDANAKTEKLEAHVASPPAQSGLSEIKRKLSTRRPRKSRQSSGAGGSNGNASSTTRTKPSRSSEPLEVAAARRSRQDHIRRFSRLLNVPSPHDVQIDLDVPRTISNHVHFHTRYGLGQRSLFRVLHCFSLLCPQCGYCQGMGSLAATLLSYYPEEQAYALLVALHDSPKYALHDLFSPGFPGLLEGFHVQEKLAELLLPGLNGAMQREGVVGSAYATRWHITLFSSVVPFETQLRLWDVFLLVGRDAPVLFSLAVLHSLSLTVLRDPKDAGAEAAQGASSSSHPHSRSHSGNSGSGSGNVIVSSDPSPAPELDFEHIMSTLNQVFVPEDDEALLRWVERLAKDRRVQEVMGAARREWRSGAGVV
ncbi:RabGAP/TBC [Microstroma glucosiphilum]|uniref:RabGAP/TBC n=1 Tax=Pseudomicrostroma glucosiphilum TaxID=1684307 RepID=A0A316TZ31_9BASI|nr:RabGAP/TBC [Pseudomicrostroma glucosiphilum]PWN17944.1 RabGAP/TBC [Pseudomicrostroma glucosiphilum]